MQYQLQTGDSLQALALANRTSVPKLLADNPRLATGGFHVGDTIHISIGSSPTSAPGLVEYPLQTGDSLDSIATQLLHNQSRAGELMAPNAAILSEVQHGAHFEVGDRLLVPATTPPHATPNATPAANSPHGLDNSGITARGPAVTQAQQAANAWLATSAGQTWAASAAGQSATAGAGRLAVDGQEGPHTRAVVAAMRAAGATPATITPAASTYTTPTEVVVAEQRAANAWLGTPAGRAWVNSNDGQAAVASTGGQLPVTGTVNLPTLAVMQGMLQAEVAEAQAHVGNPAGQPRTGAPSGSGLPSSIQPQAGTPNPSGWMPQPAAWTSAVPPLPPVQTLRFPPLPIAPLPPPPPPPQTLALPPMMHAYNYPPAGFPGSIEQFSTQAPTTSVSSGANPLEAIVPLVQIAAAIFGNGAGNRQQAAEQQRQYELQRQEDMRHNQFLEMQAQLAQQRAANPFATGGGTIDLSQIVQLFRR